MTDSDFDELEKYIGMCKRMEEYVKQRTLTGNLPTFRQLAKRYRVSQKIVVQMTEDVDLLNFNIGIQIQNGHAVFENRGDYTVEWTGDDDQLTAE